MENKKTLWYINKYFGAKLPTTPGGRDWNLLKVISDNGHTICAIGSDSNLVWDRPELKKSVTIENVEDVKVIWLKTYKYKVAKSISRIFSWFHFEWNLFFLDKKKLPKPDTIVVSSLSLLTILNGILLKRKYKCRLIFEIRDIWPLTIVEEGGFSNSNLAVKLLGYVEKLGYKNSDAIIGTMPNLVEHVLSVCDTKAPVHCIPMGVSEAQINDGAELPIGYKEKYLSSSAVKIVHAGTIGITNALDVFFEAAVILKDNANIQFVIVGDGPLREKYIEQYSHLNNIVFAPKVNKYQVQSVLSECDIVYFSTFDSKVWKYGQSLNKVIDYMLSGKPIIASYSGYPSMINEADCGEFVLSGDSKALSETILKFANMPSEQLLLKGKKGKDWLLENRSYDKLAKNFEHIVF